MPYKGKFDSYKDYISKLKKIAMPDPRRNHPADYLDRFMPARQRMESCSIARMQTKLRQCPVDKTGDYPIPNSVVGIDDKAFFQCTKLTNVTIPSSVTSIGNRAFMGCSGLTGLTIPAGVKAIGTRPFADCEKLKTIAVDAQNSAYSSADGVLFRQEANETPPLSCRQYRRLCRPRHRNRHRGRCLR